MQTLIDTLLRKRGIKTKKEREIFFNPDYERDVLDPFGLVDMEKAVERIISAIDNDEKIAIYSDFDADGIPAGVILHDFFKKIEYENFVNYIPHRDTQGYGFHTEAIDELKTKGVSVIITVDVGIADISTCDYAKENDIDVIITDHHLTKDTLPDAVAVINPQRKDDTYENKNICGAGVAFKVVQALVIQARRDKKEWIANVVDGWEKWLLDLVAIATISDMVSLTGENRALVHFGLMVLRKSKRPGIDALCKQMRLQKEYLTEDDIGFAIAPRINASSRMGSPETAFNMLSEKDASRATDAAKQLESLNRKRKASVASIVRALKKRFSDDPQTAERSVLVAGDTQYNTALLGLAASSISDKYKKTVCIWGREGTGDLKGSCRSAGGVHIVDLFKGAEYALEKYGGHKYAGGFSVKKEYIHTIADEFNKAVQLLKTDKAEGDSVVADAQIPQVPIERTYSEINKMAPFGMGNAKPIFVYKNAPIASIKTFGTDDSHLEVSIKQNGALPQMRAIAFFKGLDSFDKQARENSSVDIVGTLEKSRFLGRVRYEIRILDIQ